MMLVEKLTSECLRSKGQDEPQSHYLEPDRDAHGFKYVGWDGRGSSKEELNRGFFDGPLSTSFDIFFYQGSIHLVKKVQILSLRFRR